MSQFDTVSAAYMFAPPSLDVTFTTGVSIPGQEDGIRICEDGMTLRYYSGTGGLWTGHVWTASQFSDVVSMPAPCYDGINSAQSATVVLGQRTDVFCFRKEDWSAACPTSTYTLVKSGTSAIGARLSGVISIYKATMDAGTYTNSNLVRLLSYSPLWS